MPNSPVDPATLGGDDLVQWYRRSPWDIAQERQAARRQQYNDFFGIDPIGSDDGDAMDEDAPEESANDVDSGDQSSPQTSFPAPSFGPIPYVPGLLGDLSRLSQMQPQGDNTLPAAPQPMDDAQTDPAETQDPASGSDASPEGGGADGVAAQDEGDPPYDSSSAQSAQGFDPSSSRVMSTAPASNVSQTNEWIKRRNAQVRSARPKASNGHKAGPSVERSKSASSPRTVGPRIPSRTPSAVPASASSPLDAVGNAFKKFQEGPPIRPPSAMETFIPVVGPAWQATSDLQRGHYGAAAFNGALAASDLFLGGEIAKGLAKGGFYVAEDAAKEAPYAWDTVRRWMGDQGMVQPGEHGHHWLIPQNGWGKKAPEWLKNQPWNIKPLDRVTHGRVHHSWKGQPQFNPAQRYWYGTPAWSKVGAVAAVGHPVAAAEAQSDQGR